MNWLTRVWSSIKRPPIPKPSPIVIRQPPPPEEDPGIEKLKEDIERVRAAVPVVETIVVDPRGDVLESARTSPRKQLTKNFHIDEFKCHDGTVVPKEFFENVLELAENLQVLRTKLGKPIHVVSGYRTPDYNKKIGGAKKSQHMSAKAADIKVKGIGPKRLSERVKALIAEGSMKKGGVGIYPTFTHYDVRGTNARWWGTRKKS